MSHGGTRLKKRAAFEVSKNTGILKIRAGELQQLLCGEREDAQISRSPIHGIEPSALSPQP